MHWDPPRVFASTTPDGMGMTDTVSAVSIESDGNGGSIISMRKYYKTELSDEMASGIQNMMQNALSGSVLNLTKEFGCEVIEQ